MRWLTCTLLVGGLVAAALAQPAAEWRSSSRETRLAVHAVVEAQLAALQAGKFDEAYAFAARGIREQFRPAVFAELIRRGYPQLPGHRTRALGLVRDDGERRAYVDVRLSDSQGRPGRYRYQLVREGAAWRVEGVVALPVEGARGEL